MNLSTLKKSAKLTFLALLATACMQGARADEAGIEKDKIRLGGVFALSGGFRLATQPYEEAVRAYFNDLNKAGGINGRTIEYVVEDDAFQPSRSVAGAKKLVERDGVFAIFGAMGSSPTAAISPYANEQKVPFFSYAPTPSPSTRYVFGLAPRFDRSAYFVTQYYVESRKYKKIGFLYQNDAAGTNARPGVERALKEGGLTLDYEVGYERGTTNFETYVLKLRDMGVDALFVSGAPTDIALAIKAANAVGYKPQWGTYGAAAMALPMINTMGDAMNGIIVASEVNPYGDDKAVRDHAEQLAKYYPNTKPDYTTLLGYAQARMLAEIIKSMGANPTREGLIQALEGPKKWEVGVMAPLSYHDNEHQAIDTMRLFQWRNNKPEMISDWRKL